MTLPRPDRVDADLREIEHLLPSVRELYRWAYGWVLSSGGGSSFDGGGHLGFHDVDPTGEAAARNTVILSKSDELELRALRRKTLGKAAGKVLAAVQELQNARKDLERVVGPVQNQMAERPARNAVISAEEFQASRDALRRRVNRGGGFGEQ